MFDEGEETSTIKFLNIEKFFSPKKLFVFIGKKSCSFRVEGKMQQKECNWFYVRISKTVLQKIASLKWKSI